MLIKQDKLPARDARPWLHSSRKPAKGATSINKQEVKSVKWGRYVLAMGLLVAVGFSASKVPWSDAYKKTQYIANKPLASVRIEGEFRFVEKATLQALISPKLDGNFVDIDLKGVKQSLEANPWIKQVNVERVWPDSLTLKIEEHQPIARMNHDGFINREGILVKVADNMMLDHLPVLLGDEGESHTLAKNYVFFARLMKGHQLKISELKLDETNSWSIKVDQGFELMLGEADVHKKLESFSYVFGKYLKDKKNTISSIDMRYDKGLAVGWKQDLNVALSLNE